MQKNNYIDWEIIQKSFNGDLTQDEAKNLSNWLSESPEHLKYYQKALRGGTSNPVDGLTSEVKMMLKQMLNKKYTTKPQKTFNTRKVFYWSAAAFIPIFMLLGYSIFFVGESIFPKHQSQESILLAQKIKPGSSKATIILENGSTIEAPEKELRYDIVSRKKLQSEPAISKLIIPKGGEYILVLADSSKIWLNSESEIEYSVNFTKNKREVFLKGEAYFEVKKDPKRPFTIKTSDFTVKVIGTSFNINTYRNLSSSTLTVESGKVEVTSPHGLSKTLTAREQFSINRIKRTEQITTVDVNGAIAWKNGYLDFNKESLLSIAKKISRWYEVDVKIKSEKLKQTRFTGRIYKYSNAGSILEMLRLTGDIIYEVRGREIVIYPN